MRLILITILFFYVSACCRPILPKGDNYTLTLIIRKTDDISGPNATCDGDIIIESPRGPDVTYLWSHDATATGHQVGQLCPGMYKVTVTQGTKSRISQIMIN